MLTRLMSEVLAVGEQNLAGSNRFKMDKFIQQGVNWHTNRVDKWHRFDSNEESANIRATFKKRLNIVFIMGRDHGNANHHT